MALPPAQKAKVLEKVRVHDKDTGSSEAQVALFTKEIEVLSKHLKKHQKDNSSRLGLLKMAVGNRQLIRAFVYAIKTESGEEAAFLEALKKVGFELKVKDLQIFPGGMKKGDWDVGIAIDAVILADKIDVAVLVEGDGDFVPLVDYLKTNKGVKVEVMAFGRSASSKLIQAANEFYDLEEAKDKVLLK